MTHFSLVTKPYVDDEGLIWPRTKVLTDPSGANPETVYDGEAHGEARRAGIHECTSIVDWHKTPTPWDCGACAVEEGVAVMIEWNLDTILSHALRELSKARTRAIVKAHEGMWDTPKEEPLADWERDLLAGPNEADKCRGCQIQDGEVEGNTLTPCTCGHKIGYPVVPEPTTGTQQAQALGVTLVRHAASIRLTGTGAELMGAVCGAAISEEQLGAQTSKDRDAWGMYCDVAEWCPDCSAIVHTDDEDEED